MKKCLCLSVITILTIFTSASALDNPIRVSFQTGMFVPSDWQVQGESQISHDGLNWPDIEFFGFGNGADLILSCQYDFAKWGIRAESGVRLFESRKLISGSLGLPANYENRMQIIPVAVDMIRRFALNDPDFSPYIGVGAGIYFIDIDTKYSLGTDPYSRTWLKESTMLYTFQNLAGFDYRVYNRLFVNFEFRYEFCLGDIRLDNVDNERYTNYHDLNFGGTALRMGLGYRF